MPDQQSLLENFPGAVPTDEAEARALLDTEWRKAVSLMRAVTGVDDPRIVFPGGEAGAAPNAALGSSFETWRTIRSSWDRKSMLPHIAFGLSRVGMATWRKANLYTIDRRPDMALALLKGAERPSRYDRSYADHCGAFAMAHLGMTQYGDALTWARLAAEAAPSSARLHVVLADALMLTGSCDEANAVYSRRMSEAKPMEGADDPIAEMFANLLARDTGSVGSPIFAVTIAESIADPEQSARLWTLLEAEYYDSPYLRIHHAYYLMAHGQKERGSAKLMALAMHMPWAKEATLNAKSLADAGHLGENADHLKAALGARNETPRGKPRGI